MSGRGAESEDPIPVWRAWVLASRPRTLPAALGPVVVGTALAVADGSFHLPSVLVALILAVLLQVLANLANDYFDDVHGYDRKDRVGPLRATASGLLSHRSMRIGIMVVIAVIVLIGIQPVLRIGFPAAAVGALAIICAIAYSAGPIPFSTNGLGDPFVFLFFGPVAVCGTYYLQARLLTVGSLVAAIPVGALVTAILVVNNHRDIDSDSLVGKVTLAVRIGRKGSLTEFYALLAVAYLSPAVLARVLDSWWVLVAYASLPLAVLAGRDIRIRQGPGLNQTLARTALLSLAYSILLAAGIVLSSTAGSS